MKIATVETSTGVGEVLVWDARPPVGKDYFLHQLSLCTKVIQARDRIFRWSRGRRTGEVLRTGMSVVWLFEALPQFISNQIAPEEISFAGTLLGLRCYRALDLAADEALVCLSDITDTQPASSIRLRIEGIDENGNVIL